VIARKRQAGLTLVEMALVMVLIAILAGAAIPMLHNRYRRTKEVQLKRTLTVMRDAIDRYHEYAAQGMIEPWDLDWRMYPKDLESLVEGVEIRPAQDQEPVTVRFLREIPIDPLTGEASWDCRGYDDDPDERSSSCEDLYDVFSQSEELATDGSYYRDW
jgi:general secretion pathway protein G